MRIAIIGGGFGGIGAAIKLREAGYDAITIFEKALKDSGYIKVPTPCTQRALSRSRQLSRLVRAAGRAGCELFLLFASSC